MLTICNNITQGLKQGLLPKLTEDGTSGTYLFKGTDSSRPLAVFKPVDEEQFAPNNPRSFRGNFGDATFRQGVQSGEATVRELAAYLIDHSGFSSVPPTVLAEISGEVFPSHDDPSC